MKQIKNICCALCLMAGTCLMWSCIEEYEADIDEEDNKLLVVEGTICSSQPCRFMLSYTQPLSSFYKPRLTTGATVSVRGNDGTEFRALENYGSYTCTTGTLNPDVEYYLHIEIDGEVYESEPQKPLRTEGIADVRGVQNSLENCIDVLVTPDTPHGSDKTKFYSWTCDETWEVHPDYTTQIYFDTEQMKAVFKPDQFPKLGWKDGEGTPFMVASSSNYEGQHIQGFKLYDIDLESEKIYHRYSGLIHQRAISKGEYEYELARSQASSDMGGLFSPLPSALPTNIRCLTSHKHVIGFVGCSLNTTDYRFSLDAKDFDIRRPPQNDTRIWFDDTDLEDCLRMVNRGLFLCEYIDKRMEPGGRLRTAWAYREQLDVRYKGAYIEEPDFWKELFE